MPRINVYFSDPDLWPRIQQAAREASAQEGRTISASEWLAEAARKRLVESERKP
jgi:hypothetical protein